MNSGEQAYCISWNSQQSHVFENFGHLRHSGALADVTLCTCDVSFVKSHRVILAASSTYFNHIFEQLSDASVQPFVILKDIPLCDLNGVLDFIYFGKVNLAQSAIAGFLKAAHSLQIKGIVEDANQSRANTFGGPQKQVIAAEISRINSNDLVQENGSVETFRRIMANSANPSQNIKRKNKDRQLPGISILKDQVKSSGGEDHALTEVNMMDKNTKVVIPPEKKTGTNKNRKRNVDEAKPLDSPNKFQIKENHVYQPEKKPVIKVEGNKYKTYDFLQLDKAIDAVENGMSCLKAAKVFGVPSRTLYDRKRRQRQSKNDQLTKKENLVQDPAQSAKTATKYPANKENGNAMSAASVVVKPQPMSSGSSSSSIGASNNIVLNPATDGMDYESPDIFSDEETEEVEEIRLKRKPSVDIQSEKPKNPVFIHGNLQLERTPDGSYVGDSDECGDCQPYGIKMIDQPMA